MKSHPQLGSKKGFTATLERASRNQRRTSTHLLSGFTFIEFLVALSIFIIIVAILLPVSVSFYLTYQFNSETQLTISVLEYARNLALTNRNESDHGVYIGADEFIVFQGDNYASRDTSEDKDFPRSNNVIITGGTEVVFTALSGRAASTTLNATQDNKTRIILINEEGRIEF